MNNTNLTANKEFVLTSDPLDDCSVQKLLDVIVAILAEEYIAIVRQNPEIFLKQGEIK